MRKMCGSQHTSSSVPSSNMLWLSQIRRHSELNGTTFANYRERARSKPFRCRVRTNNKDTIFYVLKMNVCGMRKFKTIAKSNKHDSGKSNQMLNKWSWCFQENVISFHKTDILLLFPNWMTNHLYIWMSNWTSSHMECDSLFNSFCRCHLEIRGHVIVYFLSHI